MAFPRDVAQKFLAVRGAGSQAIFLAGSTGIAQVVVAFIYIYTASMSQPAAYGRVVAAIALGLTAVGYLDFGANALWVRERANGQMSSVELGERTSNKVLASLVVSGCGALALLFILPGTDYWIAAPICTLQVINQLTQVPLRALALADRVSLSVVGDRIVAASALAVQIGLGVQPTTALWISLCIGVTFASAANVLLTPREGRIRLSFSWRANPWRGSKHYGIYSIATGSQGLDISILAGVGGAGMAGLYGAVSKWTQPLGLLSAAYSSASTPFVARARNWREARPHIVGTLWMPGLAMLACVAVAVSAPLLVVLLLGDKYTGAIPVLQILAIGTIPAIANQPLAVFLQALGYDKLVAMCVSIAVLVQLGTLFFTVRVAGAAGGAISFALMQFGLCVVLSVFFLRRTRLVDSEISDAG